MKKFDIMNMELIKSYDAYCKKILANKYIVSYLLKDFLYEYEKSSIEEILSCIDSKIQIGDEDVFPDEIRTLNSEDTSISEGKVMYDLLFQSRIPKSKDSIDLFVNVEAQKEYYPGYEIKNRALVYASRMISRQYPLYKNSHYDKIKKVVSIWICVDVPSYLENKIMRYHINGNISEENKILCSDELDKMKIIIVCLGKSTIDAIQILETLFKGNMEFNEKLEMLESKYQLKFTRDEKKEAETVCNLGEGIFEKGLNQGISQGISQGIVDNTIKNIKSLMKTMNWSETQAMDALSLTNEEKNKYTKLINIKKEGVI